MWADALAAHRDGRVRVTEARASDFFGPGVVETELLRAQRRGRLLAGRKVRVLGDPGRAPLVDLCPRCRPHARRSRHRRPGVGTGVARPHRAGGQPAPAGRPASARWPGRRPARVGVLPAAVLTVAGLVSPQIRELRETRYQFDRPFVLDSSACTGHLRHRAHPARRGPGRGGRRRRAPRAVGPAATATGTGPRRAAGDPGSRAGDRHPRRSTGPCRVARVGPTYGGRPDPPVDPCRRTRPTSAGRPRPAVVRAALLLAGCSIGGHPGLGHRDRTARWPPSSRRLRGVPDGGHPGRAGHPHRRGAHPPPDPGDPAARELRRDHVTGRSVGLRGDPVGTDGRQGAQRGRAHQPGHAAGGTAHRPARRGRHPCRRRHRTTDAPCWPAVARRIVPVDPATRAVGTPLDLGPGRTVSGMALSPTSSTLLRAGPRRGGPGGHHHGPGRSRDPDGAGRLLGVLTPRVVVSADGSTVYVVGQGGADYGGRLVPIDAATGAVGAATSFDQFGITDPSALALTADGSTHPGRRLRRQLDRPRSDRTAGHSDGAGATAIGRCRGAARAPIIRRTWWWAREPPGPSSSPGSTRCCRSRRPPASSVGRSGSVRGRRRWPCPAPQACRPGRFVPLIGGQPPPVAGTMPEAATASADSTERNSAGAWPAASRSSSSASGTSAASCHTFGIVSGQEMIPQ